MRMRAVASPVALAVFAALGLSCGDGGSTTGTGGSAAGGTSGGAAGAGSAGTTGTAGASGTTGAAGTAGAAGTTGAAGTAGAAGTTGAAGAAGAAGATGAAGAAGAAGATGAAGTTGAGGTAGSGGRGGTAGGAAGRGGTAGGGTAGSGGGGTGGGSAGAGGAAGRGGNAGSAGGGGAQGAGGAGGTGTAGTGGGGAAATKLIGFATLNGGTTGGVAGQTVTASTYADLKSYAESSTAYVIRVMGTISNGANGGQINVKSNKSIIGVGSTAYLYGVGLNISSANNIIVQNLRLSMTGVTTRTETSGVYTASNDEGVPAILVNGGDAISIQGTSKNIWIDHCELFNEDPAVQTNHDLYDGLIDIKNQTGFITISWSYFHDHHKAGLVGSSDSDVSADRKITFHHNHYDNVKLRIPMYRGAVGHFFNNYVDGATDATEIRASTCVRVEKNYYEALHYSIYTPSDAPGSTERIDNVEVMRTSRAYPANCTADIPYPYSDVLTTTTNDVKTVVPRGAGVGKI
jgi:pectate lyase